MKVIALEPGYHGKLREKGDVFDVPAGSKAKWFAPVKVTAKPEGGKPEGTTNPTPQTPPETAGLV